MKHSQVLFPWWHIWVKIVHYSPLVVCIWRVSWLIPTDPQRKWDPHPSHQCANGKVGAQWACKGGGDRSRPLIYSTGRNKGHKWMVGILPSTDFRVKPHQNFKTSWRMGEILTLIWSLHHLSPQWQQTLSLSCWSFNMSIQTLFSEQWFPMKWWTGLTEQRTV